MASVTTREVTTLGLRTRVLEAGPDGDEAIVLVHGGPGSANDWDELLPRVGEVGRAVAFDLPGFGQADKPRYLGYSAETWATFIEGALAKLGIRRVHLVATDLGAMSASAWAAARPEAFASAVMLNSGALVDYRWHAVGRLHRVPLVGQVATVAGGLGMSSVMRYYAPRVPKPVVGRWRREYDLGTRRALLRFYRNSAAVTTSTLPAELAPLDRPALVVWGGRNRFVPVRHAEDLRRSFPHARVVVLDDCGHYAHLEDPDLVARHVLPFLEEQLARPA
jgi:pimeloyl-ACP methyl ester carboxylesterase